MNKEDHVAKTEGIEAEMLFEPSPEEVLKKIVPMYLSNSVFQALLESSASELASRMAAMSNATNNAEDMIRILTIDYNKARQSAITQEISEVVSGADALTG
jgi:F-type H+-transporting ATPase subunit gamma